LLLDYSHVMVIVDGIMSLEEVVDRVRRHAAQTGQAYLGAADF